MIVPSPKLERLPFPLHGKNYFQQVIYRWTNPPRYRLLEDYIITLDDGLEIVHPANFVTDGASVPRVLNPIIEPTGPLLEGSVPHDQYYQYGYLLARYQPDLIFNIESQKLYREYWYVFGDLVPIFIGRGQKFADELLKNITIEKHGATVDASRAYLALRCFGWRAYGRYREHGPTAYTFNSLGLPGITATGVKF